MVLPKGKAFAYWYTYHQDRTAYGAYHGTEAIDIADANRRASSLGRLGRAARCC